MDYLKVQNELCSGEDAGKSEIITTKNKVVVVIGGGDTGSDCVGTARRQGAKEIYQLEILPKPPQTRPTDTPWPTWPRIMRTSSSHEEGCDRRWGVMTKKFSGIETRVSQIHCCQVEWTKKKGLWELKELPGTEFTLQADIVLLALGFEHVVQKGLVTDLGLQMDKKGNIMVNNYQTSSEWAFAAGDAVSGASLVVRAIESGRQAANAINRWLTS